MKQLGLWAILVCVAIGCYTKLAKEAKARDERINDNDFIHCKGPEYVRIYYPDAGDTTLGLVRSWCVRHFHVAFNLDTNAVSK